MRFVSVRHGDDLSRLLILDGREYTAEQLRALIRDALLWRALGAQATDLQALIRDTLERVELRARFDAESA